MRSLLTLPLGALLVVGAALLGPADGTAAFVRTDMQIAQAQPPSGDTQISSQRSINLTQEDRHTIKEIVLKDLNVKKEADTVKAEIGDPAPQGVATHEFPGLLLTKIPALKQHTYFVKGDEVVVVDSQAGKVADIVK